MANLAMLKPRTLDCDVEPKQTSKEALQSGKNPTCIFYNSCSATEAGIGLLFIVYRTLHVKIDLLEKYLKKGLLETKLYIFFIAWSKQATAQLRVMSLVQFALY